MKRNAQNVLIVSIAVLVLALVGAVGLLQGTAQPPAQEPAPAANAEIQALREALQQPDLSPEARRALQEKLEMAERLAESGPHQAPADPNRALDAKQNADLPMPEAPARSQRLEEEYPETLFEGSQGLVRPSVADVRNGWQGVRSGQAMQLFAGAAADDPQQGVLVLVRMDEGTAGREMQVIAAPAGTGALRITAVAENLVTLADATGAAWTFDLNSLEYRQP